MAVKKYWSKGKATLSYREKWGQERVQWLGHECLTQFWFPVPHGLPEHHGDVIPHPRLLEYPRGSCSPTKLIPQNVYEVPRGNNHNLICLPFVQNTQFQSSCNSLPTIYYVRICFYSRLPDPNPISFDIALLLRSPTPTPVWILLTSIKTDLCQKCKGSI